jgi:hypothetical protein
MTATVTTTETAVFTALRGLVLEMLPDLVVIRGQSNRAPEPLQDDFMVMFPLRITRLSTNFEEYTDPYPDLAPGQRFITFRHSHDVQIDVHGPHSAENAEILSALAKDRFASDYLRRADFDGDILDVVDPKQIAFENAEQQTEMRWIVEVSLQVNQTVTVTQDFFDKARVGLINVDAEYPP